MPPEGMRVLLESLIGAVCLGSLTITALLIMIFRRLWPISSAVHMILHRLPLPPAATTASTWGPAADLDLSTLELDVSPARAGPDPYRPRARQDAIPGQTERSTFDGDADRPDRVARVEAADRNHRLVRITIEDDGVSRSHGLCLTHGQARTLRDDLSAVLTASDLRQRIAELQTELARRLAA